MFTHTCYMYNTALYTYINICMNCTQAVGFLLHVISLERGMRIMKQEEMHIYTGPELCQY